MAIDILVISAYLVKTIALYEQQILFFYPESHGKLLIFILFNQLSFRVRGL